MKFSPEVEEFLKHDGRCLIIENGEPKFVITSLHEYLELVRSRSAAETHNHAIVAELNRDIEALVSEAQLDTRPSPSWPTGFADALRHEPKQVFYAEE